jgi:TRAP-type C4-dicarboxylate transport system permease large subunit
VTAASATIGPIIPPSIPLIVYAVMANTSATALLIAGLLPGVLMGLLMMVVVAIQARRRNIRTEPWEGVRALFWSFIFALPPLVTPVIIIGGMWSGVFTPTEGRRRRGALCVDHCHDLLPRDVPPPVRDAVARNHA